VIDDYVAGGRVPRGASGILASCTVAGELILGGVFTDPVDKALLIFRTENAAVVEDFARTIRSYQWAGQKWTVRPWTVAIGINLSGRP